MRDLELAVAIIFLFGACLTHGAASDNCHVQFRRDYFLSDWTYPEPWAKDPTTGGRLHFVMPMEAAGTPPYTAHIGGYSIPIEHSTDIAKVTNGNVQWIHFESSGGSRGVLSLHSPSDAWILSIGDVSVIGSNGSNVASCKAGIADLDDANAVPLLVSYVTSRSGGNELVVHIRNKDNASAHSLSAMVVNGAPAAKLGYSSIPAEGHQVFVVKLYDGGRLLEGDTWTVEVLVDNTSWIGNGGRIGKEEMFVEGWQHSSSCPFPVQGGQTSDFLAFRDVLGMNAFYGFSACTNNYAEVLANATSNGYFIMLPDVLNFPFIADPSRLMCVEAGDEVDNQLDDTKEQWKKVLSIREKYPKVVVYEGGKTNHWAGAFAGISDIQGIDFYVAACAPHITPALTPMSLTGSRDYIRNYRNNHMPLTTWGYSQAICTSCWSTVPSSAEFTIQIASAFIAGVKSLMLFMADEAAIGLQAFADGGSLIRSFNAVKEIIRTGDVQGAQRMTASPASAAVMMETIAAPNNTFLIIVASTNAGSYSDLLCALGVDNHWIFQEEQLNSVTAVVLPSWQQSPPTRIAQAFEAKDGELIPLPANGASVEYSAAQTAITVSGISLGVDIVARLFYVQLA